LQLPTSGICDGSTVSAVRVAVFKAPAAGIFTLTVQAVDRANSAGNYAYYTAEPMN